MAYQIGPKGEVLIPAEIREKAGLELGADVVIEPVKDGVIVRRAHLSPSLRGRFAGSGMASRLLEDRHQGPQ